MASSVKESETKASVLCRVGWHHWTRIESNFSRVLRDGGEVVDAKDVKECGRCRLTIEKETHSTSTVKRFEGND